MVEGEVKFEGINNMQSKRYLVLEDGSFKGYRLGSDNLTVGELYLIQR